MAFMPIRPPPGVFKNGTHYLSKGRWQDANLVRWQNGILMPVGGWQQFIEDSPTVDGTPSGMLAWVDNSSDTYVAMGTDTHLYALNSSGIVTDITPAAFVTGDASASQNTGYGGGPYGSGFYGTPRPLPDTFIAADSWSMDTWGENLVSCYTADGRLFEWTPGTPTALVIAGAPVDNVAVGVTEERFLFALGSGGNPRNVAWSDREDNTTWTPSATNEAGDIDLQTQGAIRAGCRVRGQYLVLTSTDAHTATYQGPPFVYGFERVGTACGVISKRALTPFGAGAAWMGYGSFFVFTGGAVQEISCDVEDWVFGDLNQGQRSLIHCFANEAWGEIWWFFPSSGSTVCDRYVVWDHVDNLWVTGMLERTAACPSPKATNPYMADEDAYVWAHEIGFNYDGDLPYAETGPIEIAPGDNVMRVLGLYPDEKTQGDVESYIKTRFYPNGTERSYGPFTSANPTSFRATGREVMLRVQGVSGGAADFRVGEFRLQVRPGGLR